MKINIKHTLEVLALLMSLAWSQNVLAADKPSVHGMLMFGEKKIFFSHLPMFHSPHDYQAIFSVKLNDEAKALYLSDKKTHPEEKVYTFVPEVMVLPEAVLNTKTFKGEIYRGHFERGGTSIAKGIQVSVEDVIVFKKFAPKAIKPSQSSYLLFGKSGEYWMAHDIVAKPDFDHILAVNLQDESVLQQPLMLLSIENSDNLKPLVEGKSFSAKSGAVNVNLQSLQNTYLEFDDLAM